MLAKRGDEIHGAHVRTATAQINFFDFFPPFFFDIFLSFA